MVKTYCWSYFPLFERESGRKVLREIVPKMFALSWSEDWQRIGNGVMFLVIVM